MIPELVVAAIVVLVVQTVERLFVHIPQAFVNEVELCRDAWVEQVRVFLITNKQHIVGKCIQSVAYPRVLLVHFLPLEGSFNLALGVEMLVQFKHVVVNMVEVFGDDLFTMFAKHSVDDPVADVRLRQQIFLEVESVGCYLLARHAQRWRKLSAQAVDTANRYFPNAEESQYMVDAVSIEKLCHVLETAFPPCASVFQHLVPVVGGEPPILSVDGEIIGWRTSLSVHVEVFGFYPNVTTVTTDTNRHVAFEYDALALRIGVRLFHLGV